MEEFCKSQEAALAELHRTAPNAPFLALGQTVFWDEPMKSGVIQTSSRLGYKRRFTAGVHDTDYFAKSPIRLRKRGFKALPHNDTTTKGLWSAAGEFSFLFGSETVISRDVMRHAGAKVARIEHERPGMMDELTEAWGWRGIVSSNESFRIAAEKPLAPLFKELYSTFEWAVEASFQSITGKRRKESRKAADALLAAVCNASEDAENTTLSEYYQRLIPSLYSLSAGEEIDLDVTSTTQLLKFSRSTVRQGRFDLLDLFVRPETRQDAENAYNEAVAGSEIYTLDRFGTGAIPFDLYIPGRGRGTIRLGNRGCVVMTPIPVAFSFKQPLRSAAVIGMLARDYVFVFHEGASGYVWRSRQMHQTLAKQGHGLKLNPILRVSYEPWDALADCAAWFKLPEPLRRPFGTEELSAAGFALRWREAVKEGRSMLEELAGLKRPLSLIRWLQGEAGGHWEVLGKEYERLHDQFVGLNDELNTLRAKKKPILDRIKHLKAERVTAEKAKGDHWREKIFEKEHTQKDLAAREELTDAVKRIQHEIEDAWAEWRVIQHRQDSLVASKRVEKARARRQSISLEAELMRIRLIREAVIASDGLEKAGHRPAAWWQSVVSPSGQWHQSTMQRARYSVEPLT
jgi:hypothetical protein